MSDELNILDQQFLHQCESGVNKNVRKKQEFKEPKENKRKDNKRIVTICIEESTFQYIVDQARSRNVSVNACISQVFNELATKS